MNRGTLVMLLAAANLTFGLDGTALSVSGGSITLTNMNTMSATVIKRTTDFVKYNVLSGPCFSPDGKQVAYMRYQLNSGAEDGTHVLIMNNDGTDVRDLCMAFSTGLNGAKDLTASWANNGYVYWSENGSSVYRVNVSTKARETVCSLNNLTGVKPSIISFLKVSADGTRGACMVTGTSQGAFAFDFTTLVSKSMGAGCQGTISPDGQLVTHNLTAREGYSYHQLAYVHRFSDTTVACRITVDNAATPSAAGTKRFVFHRFSHSSNNHVVYTGEDALSGTCEVVDIRTNTSTRIGTGTALDFREGTLPPPPAATARIALDKSVLTFASTSGSVPVGQSIAVTNSGTGTLTQVTVSGAPAWLTVTTGGSGNAQTLLNTASAPGLAAGVYTDTVSVSGGGSPTSATYIVTLNVGSAVNAPTGLSVTSQGATSLLISWNDNSSNETGFSVERKTDTGTWTEVRRTAANIAAWTDTGLAVSHTYTYRVRAFAATAYSAYSNEASHLLTVTASLTLTGISAASQWISGNAQNITWTAVAVSQVDLEYSLDDGLTWLLINSTGSITSSMSTWGSYPFTAPDTCLDNFLVRVKIYGAPSPSAMSAPFSITGCRTAVAPRTSWARRDAAACRIAGSSITFAAQASEAGPVRVQIYSVNGSLTASAAMTPRDGTWQASLDRTTWPSGRYVACIGAAGTGALRTVPFVLR